MPNLQNYPFKSLRVIDGQQYISVQELNEILDNLKELGPIFSQVASATQQLKDVFGNARKTTDNLLVEIQKAQGKSGESLGVL